MQLDKPDAREKHAEYAYELILNSWARIGNEERRVTLTINDRNARRAIAEVARGHWTTYALQLKQEDYIYGNQRGRTRLLGTLLAMADLLDLSPVRAGYFRTVHRLYDPEPISELHQTMHDLSRGFEIIPPDPNIPGELQFQLEWNSNDAVVQDISHWALHWFTSQWRQLKPVLYKDSGGSVRWASKWAKITFNPPAVPVQKLSKKALHALNAELAEQKRIDRKEFAEQFQKAFKPSESVLFILHRNSENDGKVLSEWCEAYSRNLESSQVARIDVQPAAVLDISSAASQIIEQWGDHLPECDDEDALAHFNVMLSASQAHNFVIILVTEKYKADLLQPLLENFFERSGNESARVCVLLASQTKELKIIDGVQTHNFELPEISEHDIVDYFCNSLGYNNEDGQTEFNKIVNIGLKSSMLYNYIESFCNKWINEVK
ncbi:MAG: hypothetical protein GY749_14010 [Desulfobacteraceae bacterium]|nr:hypothetical protein [Desulfobacteraceae bacterium]